MTPVTTGTPTRDYLTLCVTAWPHQKTGGLSPYQWLLDHGIAFDGAPFPKRLRRGQPRMCFWNSLKLAARGRGRYVYCEGYATHFIPVHHAWCLDRQTGLVADPTWESGHDYIGVPIKNTYARGIFDDGCHAPLWDWMHGFPIMTGQVPLDVWLEEFGR